MANLEGLHHLHCLVCCEMKKNKDGGLYMHFMSTACADFFGGDTLLRIYCVKLSIGISRIIIVVVKGRFEMRRGLWRGMLVS